MLFIRWALGLLGGVGLLVGAYAWITTGAYNRGFEARDKEARAYIEKLETRLAERMRQNEGLTTEEIDCQLRRLRNPKAECGK
jgi:hypothetical protein